MSSGTVALMDPGTISSGHIVVGGLTPGGHGTGLPPPLLGDYDFYSEENAGKWRGLFRAPLQKVLNQVHPQFKAKEDALEYVEDLLIRLLSMLTAKPAPLTVADGEVSSFQLR